LQVRKIFEEFLHFQSALLLRADIFDVILEVHVTYALELSPEVLNERVCEKLQSRLLTVFVEDVEKLGSDVLQERAHRLLAAPDELTLLCHLARLNHQINRKVVASGVFEVGREAKVARKLATRGVHGIIVPLRITIVSFD